MSSEAARECADDVLGNIRGEDLPSSSSFPGTRDSQSQRQLISSSSYTLASDESVFSRDVDHWIRGSVSPTETGVQGSRVATAQRSTLVTSSFLNASGLWYLTAMVLPLLSVNNGLNWRCTPSTILNTAELLLTQLARLCRRTRAQIRRLAEDQIARDIFATAMDIVLIIYAIGFLALSLYQASIIG